MISLRVLLCGLSAALLVLFACRTEPPDSSAPPSGPGAPSGLSMQVDTVNLEAHFGDGIEGTFVVLDPATDRLRVYNMDRAQRRFIPASTFKIANSIIALETGVADGADFALSWDSTAAPPADFWPQSWRQDHVLRTAFRNSVVWYYQEIARRIGAERMAAHLHALDYGNGDTGGGIDRFWLDGDLRISPMEQVRFLRRLYEGTLGVDANTTAALKDVMLLEETAAYRLSGKTGTAELTETRELGWLVGFVEVGGGVHYYALNMEGEQVWEEWPPQVRIGLVKSLLQELEVVPGADS